MKLANRGFLGLFISRCRKVRGSWALLFHSSTRKGLTVPNSEKVLNGSLLPHVQELLGELMESEVAAQPAPLPLMDAPDLPVLEKNKRKARSDVEPFGSRRVSKRPAARAAGSEEGAPVPHEEEEAPANAPAQPEQISEEMLRFTPSEVSTKKDLNVYPPNYPGIRFQRRCCVSRQRKEDLNVDPPNRPGSTGKRTSAAHIPSQVAAAAKLTRFFARCMQGNRATALLLALFPPESCGSF